MNESVVEEERVEGETLIKLATQVTPDMRREIARWAKADDRSLMAEVRYLLKLGLAERGRKAEG